MEVKKSASRMRVLAAALGLGLVIGAHSYFSSTGSSPDEARQSAPTSPSGEEPSSPGAAVGLRPAVGPGKSIAASKGLIAPPTPTQLQTAWTQSTIRLKYLDQCEHSATCSAFNNEQPWSYDLDVRRQTAKEIEDFTAIANTWKAEHGGDLPEEAQEIARYFLSTGNDDVKEAALGLIILAEPSEQNIRVALHAVADSVSGPLFKVLLTGPLAETSADPRFAPTWNSFINRTMKTGGEAAQKTVARYSARIFSEQTRRALAQAEKKQSPRSLSALYFRVNREEFDRSQHGG
jgi:hypothetical protein